MNSTTEVTTTVPEVKLTSAHVDALAECLYNRDHRRMTVPYWSELSTEQRAFWIGEAYPIVKFMESA